jgi:hypothetical protein
MLHNIQRPGLVNEEKNYPERNFRIRTLRYFSGKVYIVS